MISGVIAVNLFAQIRLMFQSKFGDHPLERPSKTEFQARFHDTFKYEGLYRSCFFTNRFEILHYNTITWLLFSALILHCP